MTKEIKLSDPADVHDIFKSIRKDMDFFKLPRIEALLHSFRIMEAIQNISELGLDGLDDLFLSTHSFQDIARYIIYWTYTECPEGGRDILTEEDHIEKIILVIKLASIYSKIHDFIVATQKNWATLHIDKERKLISFRYKDFEKSSLFIRKLTDRLTQQAKSIAEIQKETEDNTGMEDALDQLYDSVSVTKDNVLKYHTNRFILNNIEEFSRKSLEKEFILPDSWSIGPYGVTDFRLLWIQLNKLSIIHTFAFNMSLQKNRKNKFGPYNYSIFRIPKNILINYIKKYTDLNREIIAEIIHDLTYDYKIPFIDIMHQPLIELKENDIFFSPKLIMGSLIDRNLQVLLTKLPHRKKEYDRLKNLKEDKMIQNISDILNENQLKFRPKIRLKENNHIITDIDILIWDQSYKNFLAVQLKWFYGADSTQELYNQDEQFNEGIIKTKMSVEFLNDNFEKIATLINIPNPKGRKNIYGVIVSKMGTPSPFIQDPNFPVIEEHDFMDLISNSKRNIQNLYKMIVLLIKSKKKVPALKESSVEIKVGDFRFILPACEY